MREQRQQLAAIIEVLRCPRTGQPLVFEQDMLTTPDRRQAYRLSSSLKLVAIFIAVVCTTLTIGGRCFPRCFES